ncbi:MAG: non-ribosomal peptide synthetase, partial [Rhodocyclaceae bacterium]|nr:non-ribosomal peptide synthetase [Rhodocyclaceae bacterium]
LKAATFLKTHGFGRDTPVPMLFPPSLEAVILLYATHAIGGYIVPFSWQQPRESVVRGLESLGVNTPFLVGVKVDGFENGLKVSLTDFISLDEATACEQGAYYCQFHTSGTTGTPKSIRITHSNVNYLISALRPDIFTSGNETFIFSTSWTFDVSTIELLFWPFESGRLVIPDGDLVQMLKDVPSLAKEHRVTHLNFSPSVFNSLSRNWSEGDWAALDIHLRRIFFAGEELKPEVSSLTKSRLPGVRVFNCYGPTECTVYATIHECTGKEERSVPIGKALKGAQVELHHRAASETLESDLGEIVISGQGVAPGYLHADDHSSQRFLQRDGAWSYATGDLARILPSGDLVFVRRLDRQVQVNGIRVELSEIESVLDSVFKTPGCTRVIHGRNGLVGFYLGSSHRVPELRASADAQLPRYSRPSTYLNLDEFPLTPNGKTDDRKLAALAEMHFSSFHVSNPSQGSSSKPCDSKVISTILKIFGFDSRVAEVPLMELGLDSLDLFSGIVRLEDEFSVKIPEASLLGNATATSLACQISASLGTRTGAHSTREAHTRATSALAEAGLAQVRLYRQASQALLSHAETKEVPCHGFQRVYHFDTFESSIDLEMTFFEPLDRERAKIAVASVVEATEVLKIGAKEGRRLSLCHCKAKFPAELPRIGLPGRRQEHSDTLVSLSKQISHIAKTCEPNTILHAFLIVEFDDCVEVLWSLSHLVADAASVFILKKALASAVKGLPFESTPYSEYVKYLESKTNAVEIRSHSLTAELLRLPRLAGVVQIEALKGIRKETWMGEGITDREEIIARIAFEGSRLVSRDLNLDEFGISTVVNLRELESFDARSVVGDCHGAVVMPFRTSSNFEHFHNQMRNAIRLLRSGRSPQHAAFSSLPDTTPLQREIEEAYDTAPLLGINFLGFIAREERARMESDLLKFRASLEAFPASRIYATAFQDETRAIHLYFLNWPRDANPGVSVT